MTRYFFVFALLRLLFLLYPVGIAEAQTVSPICLGIGAFQIYDGTCKNYYICLNDGTKLVALVLSCGPIAVFDPIESQCVVGATCRQTTTPLTCSEFGAFEINDGTCQNYYVCVSNGVNLMPVVLSCSAGTIYDPNVGSCLPGAMCLQTTTTTTTTLAPPTTTLPCVRYGRFPLPDVNCKKYYLCYWDNVRYTIMSNLTCPNTLVFEPMSEKCVPPWNYVCPGTIG